MEQRGNNVVNNLRELITREPPTPGCGLDVFLSPHLEELCLVPTPGPLTRLTPAPHNTNEHGFYSHSSPVSNKTQTKIISVKFYYGLHTLQNTHTCQLPSLLTALDTHIASSPFSMAQNKAPTVLKIVLFTQPEWGSFDLNDRGNFHVLQLSLVK